MLPPSLSLSLFLPLQTAIPDPVHKEIKCCQCWIHRAKLSYSLVLPSKSAQLTNLYFTISYIFNRQLILALLLNCVLKRSKVTNRFIYLIHSSQEC